MNKLLAIAPWIAILLAWQLTCSFTQVNRLLLPSPSQVFSVFWEKWSLLLFHACITFSEGSAGLLVGIVLGTFLALLSCYFPLFGRMIAPFCVALKTTPLIVLAPCLIIWMGNGYFSKIAMAAISSFFPVYVSAWSGLLSVDQEWLDLMRLHRCTRLQTLMYLRIPYSLPEFFTGCRVASSLAMVGAVVAEFTGAENGLGHLTTTSTYYLNLDVMIAGVLILCLQGIFLYWVIGIIQNRIVFWHSQR